MNTTFQAKLRNDKRKNPMMRTYRFMTFEEVKSSNGKHILCLDQRGDVATVHITSIKVWKTRPQIEVRYQFGLYQHYSVTMYPPVAGDLQPINPDFVVEVSDIPNDIAIGYATTKNFK